MAAPAPTPRPLRRRLAARALVLLASVAVGLLLARVLAIRLDAIRALAQVDVIAARAELAFLLHLLAVGVFGSTALLGVALALASRRAMRLAVFPPPGVVRWRSARVVTGPRARPLALLSLALAIALMLASLAGGGLTWYMAGRLLACKATGRSGERLAAMPLQPEQPSDGKFGRAGH